MWQPSCGMMRLELFSNTKSAMWVHFGTSVPNWDWSARCSTFLRNCGLYFVIHRDFRLPQDDGYTFPRPQMHARIGFWGPQNLKMESWDLRSISIILKAGGSTTTAAYYSLLTTHYSLLTTHYSILLLLLLLTTHYSLPTTYYYYCYYYYYYCYYYYSLVSTCYSFGHYILLLLLATRWAGAHLASEPNHYELHRRHSDPNRCSSN